MTGWAIAAGVLGAAVAPVRAGVIATNVRIDFSHAASFADGIDRLITLSAAQGARLDAGRLGTWLSTDVAFTLSSVHSIALLDPGVATLPDADRLLLRVDAAVRVDSALLAADPFTQDLGATWRCPATALRCTSDEVIKSLPLATPPLAPVTASAQALQPWRLRASASATPLADGVSLLSGGLGLTGTLRFEATYQSKTPLAYARDALQATAGAAAPGTAARFAAASADVLALRQATWTDQAVAYSLRADRDPDLAAGQRLLGVARDTATLLQTGTAVGARFATPFALTAQLWNVAAQADPALGRAVADHTGEDVLSADLLGELAALRAVLGAHDDASFLAGLADALAHPAAAGSAAVLTLDGARLGLAEATLSLYLVGDPFSGAFSVDLPAASRHALWRTGYDRIELLDGPASGLQVLAAASGAGELLTVGGGPLYIGETFGGLLELAGGGLASRIALNNAYGPTLLVVASWDVSPVPEPASALLLGLGLAGLAAAGHRRTWLQADWAAQGEGRRAAG